MIQILYCSETRASDFILQGNSRFRFYIAVKLMLQILYCRETRASDFILQ